MVDLPAAPLTEEVLAAFEDVWSLTGATLPVTEEQVPLLRPLTRYLRERGLALSARRAMEALTVLRVFSRRFVQATDAFDVLLAPICTDVPRDRWASSTPRTAGGGRRGGLRAAEALRRLPRAVQRHRQPAVSVPLHWTADGLPVGTMLVGRPADEATLVSLAAQLEEARPWAHRHPPGW